MRAYQIKLIDLKNTDNAGTIFVITRMGLVTAILMFVIKSVRFRNNMPNFMWITYSYHVIYSLLFGLQFHSYHFKIKTCLPPGPPIFLSISPFTHIYITCVQWLRLRQNSRHVSNWNVQLLYLKMNLKSSSAKYRPYCLCLDVLIRCGRDKVTFILKTTFSSSFLTSGEIWIRYKNLHTWNGSHISAAMLCGRDKMVPLSRWYIQMNFPVWNCFIIFLQIWLKCISKFPYRNLFIILTSCSERGTNAVHRIWRHYLETFSLLLAQCADHRAPWFPEQRASDTEIYLPAFNPFRPVLFAHTRQKTTIGSIGFQNFQQCCFRLPDWWSNSTHWMGQLFWQFFSITMTS